MPKDRKFITRVLLCESQVLPRSFDPATHILLLRVRTASWMTNTFYWSGNIHGLSCSPAFSIFYNDPMSKMSCSLLTLAPTNLWQWYCFLSKRKYSKFGFSKRLNFSVIRFFFRFAFRKKYLRFYFVYTWCQVKEILLYGPSNFVNKNTPQNC
jgi:hypothetical protein